MGWRAFSERNETSRAGLPSTRHTEAILLFLARGVSLDRPTLTGVRHEKVEE